jgi:hypothetical protein
VIGGNLAVRIQVTKRSQGPQQESSAMTVSIEQAINLAVAFCLSAAIGFERR